MQVRELAEGRPQFKSVDRAIGKNSFKVVTLLRLSPLLPLALSNYFYGLTSVDLPSYVAASWLGMLPGTIAYVTAGAALPGGLMAHRFHCRVVGLSIGCICSSCFPSLCCVPVQVLKSVWFNSCSSRKLVSTRAIVSFRVSCAKYSV